MNVGIVGLGLIGGSLAKSIKKHSEHTVWGFDIDSDAVTQALMCGAIDETLTDALLPQCDVVLVAPDEEYTVNPDEFAGKSHNTPYAGLRLAGRVRATVKQGVLTYQM